MIKAVIFDWSGVLIDNPSTKIGSYCAKSLGVTTKMFVRVYKKFETGFQKGTITEDELWKRICHELKVPVPKSPSLWTSAFKQAYFPREEMFSLASNLRKRGYKVGLLSNTEIPTTKFFHDQEYIMFDEAIFSCLEGLRKPERRIFEIALERLGVQPNEAIYLDDKKENVDAAEVVGLNTILFKSPAQVKKELVSLSINVE